MIYLTPYQLWLYYYTGTNEIIVRKQNELMKEIKKHA